MVKAVIFDLDGTLLNTLQDLNNAVNHTLNYFNLPNICIEQTKSFIGNGVKKLLERAINNKNIDKNLAYDIFTKYYESHINDYTFPYDNIKELLEELDNNQIKIAVVSNKYQKGVTILCESLIKKYTNVFIGAQENVKIKPDPEMVHLALNKLNVSKIDCLFVGDSDVDILTGKNAHIKTVGVTWGYKDLSVLKNAGADYIINDPLELINILKKEKNND